jgi:hypothetical protein
VGTSEEMVLVPKGKLVQLYEQVKMLKKAIRSQKKMVFSHLENLKHGIELANQEKLLLRKQSEYLKDMQRSHSEGKTKFYKTHGNFFH